MELKFSKATDTPHKIKLESDLIETSWASGVAYMGLPAAFVVRTSFVGNGASVEVTGKSDKGKKCGKVKGEISNNAFMGALDIPDNLDPKDKVYFEVKLPKHGLNGDSDLIPVKPGVLVTNMKWSAKEARRGEILTLSADVRGAADDTEVLVTIYEFDRDSIHDKIAELKAVVKNQQIRLDWEYQYFEDTDEIPSDAELQRYGRSYNPPEYFFTVKVEKQEFGKKQQDSGLLEFKDWIEIEAIDDSGQPIKNAKYKVTLPDGTEREGSLDQNGRARLEDIPPGEFTVDL